jgi:hypothetical protein
MSLRGPPARNSRLAMLSVGAGAILVMAAAGDFWKAEADSGPSNLILAGPHRASQLERSFRINRDIEFTTMVAQFESLEPLCSLLAQLKQIEATANDLRQRLTSQLADALSQFEEVETKRKECAAKLICAKEESERLFARSEILFEQRYVLGRAVADFERRMIQQTKEQEETQKRLDELAQGKCP